MSNLLDVQEQSRIRHDFSHGMPCRVTITADRLREALADQGMDQSSLARAIGVTQGSISLILLGKTRQSKHLPSIAAELNVAYDWLIGRSDDKFADRPSEQLLTASEVEIVEAYRSMRHLDRMALQRVAEGFTRLEQDQSGSFDLPNEAALTRMFAGLLAACPDLHGDELAHELAKLLPTGLSAVQGPLSDPASDRRAPRFVLLEDEDVEHREPQRASRT